MWRAGDSDFSAANRCETSAESTPGLEADLQCSDVPYPSVPYGSSHAAASTVQTTSPAPGDMTAAFAVALPARLLAAFLAAPLAGPQRHVLVLVPAVVPLVPPQEAPESLQQARELVANHLDHRGAAVMLSVCGITARSSGLPSSGRIDGSPCVRSGALRRLSP